MASSNRQPASGYTSLKDADAQYQQLDQYIDAHDKKKAGDRVKTGAMLHPVPSDQTLKDADHRNSVDSSASEDKASCSCAPFLASIKARLASISLFRKKKVPSLVINTENIEEDAATLTMTPLSNDVEKVDERFQYWTPPTTPTSR